MPASSKRESLSMSMADLDFDPEQGKRRARAQRSKRDMGQSCSAFHFVLDKSEMAEVGGDGETGRTRTRRSNSKDRGATDSNRPSYSDLVMDVTSKTTAKSATMSPRLDLHAGSPTSVVAEERKSRHPSDTTASSDSTTISSNSPGSTSKEAVKEPTSASSSGGIRPARVIPSSSDFRTRNRITRTRSSHDSYHGGSPDPLVPGGRGRRNTNRRANSGKFSKSCHMSMDADFPEPSEFLPSSNTKATTDAFLTKQKSAHGKLSKSPSRKKGTNNHMGRFSKSFSGFDDWDPKKDLDDVAALSTTPTRRGGKRPTRASIATTDDIHNHHSSDKNHNSLSNLENSLSELDLLNGDANNDMMSTVHSYDQSDIAVIEKKVRRKSCHEKNVNGSNKPPSTRKNSRQPRSAAGRFSQSCSSFEVSPHDLVSTSVSPKKPIVTPSSGAPADVDVAPRPRRSSRILDPEELLTKEATIEVEKQKVSSLEEFQKSWSGDVGDQILFDDESPTTTTTTDTTSMPPTTRKAPRTKREPSRGVTRQGSSSGSRVRRCKTDDGIIKTTRSSHEPSGGRRRGGSKDADMHKQSGITSSTETAPRRQRRASYVPTSQKISSFSQEKGAPESQGEGVHRGVSRERKSRRASVSVIAVSSGVEENGNSPPLNRRTSRRSSAVEDDGTPPQRRTPRRTRSSDGSTPNPMKDRSSATRIGVRRTMSTDGSVKPSSSMHKSFSTRRVDSGKNSSRSPPAPRRKMPQRAKSHGGGGAGMMDEPDARERGDTSTTVDERASSSRASIAAASRAERRAMAHNIIEG